MINQKLIPIVSIGTKIFEHILDIYPRTVDPGMIKVGRVDSDPHIFANYEKRNLLMEVGK
ncbi:MAG: hypothetical protein A2374_00780 [Candidatus Moranbacteria bacterium RIFOXYB1_FULL_44_23]|nr:MAG: hypothetical protein A2194_03550 [Candidatus Moranbacteria bacterium RIFOXYA1_FULL_44_8]OGI36926.1 MAG: hypothetical protein A2407_05340 [Candidatus Moranbacteria bacterium RIFOXYC1_FULL_44_8]OGI39236.1 MAG: hypothetical protein A2374_00780 [Candidatus Moranbacteria bacterium RIFOXYB1_FULL_44_23]